MSPRKVAAIGAVIAVHGLMFYGFTHTSEMVKLVSPVTTMMVSIPDVRPAPPPPPALPPPKPMDLSPAPPVPMDVPQVPVMESDAPPLVDNPVTDTGGVMGPPSDAPPVVSLNSISIVRRTDPPYPAAERRAGHEGRVVLKVVINTEGHPVSVEITQSSGFVSLDEAARTAVERWRFGGNKTGGLVSVMLPISFRIQQ